MTAENQKIARCPHCGHDEFRVNQSENKTVRFVGVGVRVREEVLDTDGKEYPVVVCGGCGRDLDGDALLDSVLSAEAC